MVSLASRRVEDPNLAAARTGWRAARVWRKGPWGSSVGGGDAGRSLELRRWVVGVAGSLLGLRRGDSGGGTTARFLTRRTIENHGGPRSRIATALRARRVASFLRGPPWFSIVLRVEILAELRTARVSLGCPERCCGRFKRLPWWWCGAPAWWHHCRGSPPAEAQQCRQLRADITENRCRYTAVRRDDRTRHRVDTADMPVVDRRQVGMVPNGRTAERGT